MKYLLVIIISLLTSALPSSLAAEDFTPENTQAANQHPLPPQLAVMRLQVPPGFQVTLAAAEPDVQQPIAIAFDDRGRLWVAESYSYNGSKFNDDRHDRILILEDTTGDGVLDRRKVFCSGLTHLTGLQLGFGGVWITAPPHLAFIPDRDQDDTPDGDPVVHLDGWSLHAEHNSVNGLTWGPDGWLYGRHGIKQPSLVGRPGTATEARVPLSCAIWRYHPTQHQFEVVTDGTINPWGLDFDDHGHGFLTTSVVEHLWHLVPGAHYQRWKNRGTHPDPVVYETMTSTSDHLHWGSGTWDKAGRMAAGNHSLGGGHSHCDAMIYLGDRWPQRYRGSLFTSNIHGRRINRDRLLRHDGPFQGVHATDFLLANDEWFRGVSMEYGPDGDVYLTDWSDNGECHDRDGVHRTSGRIYKITWGDPIHVPVDLGSASNDQLVDYQLHQNEWFVRHARRLLQERAVSGQDMSQVHARLHDLMKQHSEVRNQLRALWALYATNGVDTAWLLSQLAADSEHLRSWAVRLLSDDALNDTTVTAAFTRLGQTESSWLVRMELAAALRRVPAKDRFDMAAPLIATTAAPQDPNLERMLWYGIAPAVDQQPQRALTLAATTTPRLRRWIARRLTEHSPKSAPQLLATAERLPAPGKAADLLQGFATALETTDIKDIPPTARPLASRLLDHDDERVRIVALTIGAALGDQATLQKIRKILHDTGQQQSVRLAALKGLVQRKSPSLSKDLQRLITTGQMTSAALRASGSVNDPTLLKTILTHYPKLSPSERVLAIHACIARPTGAASLLSAIAQKQIPATDISAMQARQIAALNDKKLLQQLETHWGTVRKSPDIRLQQIASLQQALSADMLAKANLKNGRDLFRKTCSSCHRLFDEGRTIGPVLTGANRRNLHYLLTNIVDPSAAVPADFRLTTVITSDGRLITGAMTQRTDARITLQTVDGEVRLPTQSVDTVKTSPLSMMPEGLLDKLDNSQIRDLIAWLMSDGMLPRQPAKP
ncbi:MAG: dehydrogenase [Blastopirellula sp.]|nr:dehydrogenase [Blastopirellula sp.]